MRGLTDALAERGWLRFPTFVTGRRLLVPPAGLAWRPLTPIVGRVRQAGSYIQLPLRDAPRAVRCFADDLRGMAFNEVTWQRYTPAAGYITAHRDQVCHTGVIAICTLVGEAPFSILAQRDPDVAVAWWLAGPGDLVLLRGAGFGHPEARCPLHRVDPPTRGQRLTLALRWREPETGAG